MNLKNDKDYAIIAYFKRTIEFNKIDKLLINELKLINDYAS